MNKQIEFIFYDWYAEIEYAREVIIIQSWDEIMPYAEKRCQEIMKEHDLESLNWNYNIL